MCVCVCVCARARVVSYTLSRETLIPSSTVLSSTTNLNRRMKLVGMDCGSSFFCFLFFFGFRFHVFSSATIFLDDLPALIILTGVAVVCLS